jgi:methionyl-tRNA formyltransferase
MAVRVIFITQEDPFYLAASFRYVLDHLPPGIEIPAVVVLGASPFGAKHSSFGKILRTYEVFGLRFLRYYGWRFLRAKLDRAQSVAEVFRIRNIEVLAPTTGSVNSPDFLEVLRRRRPDLLVSVAGNQVFRRAMIELAPLGCLNVHSALLPRHRGLMPTFWALKHGDSETGVSVIFVDEGIDTGPIVVQRRIPIRERCLDALLRETKRLGAEAVVEALGKLREGRVAVLPNSTADGNYNRFPTRSDVREFLSAGNRLF